ncbi:hypothetical protein SAMN04488096_101125 [Mesonia phycicola]|uniref:DUF2059 domain-containing protein n=1 Tax=Mesonia phycicola TaxID=579105 RepID=A0A1M6A7T1_9FLAO|nr:DUF2059 domain-containing protein [Mesonia phycicola]SHI32486.1 hypothetical protein SAMN04488096_101125 [Mesonia phycicola]
MKKLLIAVAFVGLSFSGFAQEETEFKKELLNFVKLNTGSEDAISPYIDQMAAGLPDRNKEAFKSEIKAELDGMYSQLVDVYIENVPKEDLEKMIEFYQTPAGKSVLSATPQVLAKNISLTQGLMMKFQNIFQKYSAQ